MLVMADHLFIVLLSTLCGIFGFTTTILACIMITRYIISKKQNRYVTGSSKNFGSKTDKIIFSSEDLVWAMDAKVHSLNNIDITQDRSRRNTISMHNAKLLHKMSTAEVNFSRQGTERSQYTIMSSTLSLDQKTSRQNIAYLSGKRQVFCSFVTSSQMKVPNFKKKVSYLKELCNLNHENINQFWGVFADPYKQGFLFEFAKRGSLQDVLLHSENKFALDWTFKQALVRDLVNGMRYLHRSNIKYHGNLTSTNCVIDHRWVLKISRFALSPLVDCVSRHEHPVAWLWTSPEHLRENRIGGTPKGDVYSFGIILQEVITETEPFGSSTIEPADILKKVEKPPPFCRPSVSNGLAPPPYIHLMKECWAEHADRRPSFDDIGRRLRQMNKGQKMNIIDNILKKLEKYSNHLEDTVRDRTLELESEKRKTEQLLSRMLPVSVAEDLKAGKPVHPEHYDQVTIFFSDIVGFTTISAASTPMQIVTLLNMLYTRFDEIIGHHDVYKVETIGDAYMCVSGLPVRNGNKHAGEIAKMSLDFLSASTEMKVPHLPLVPLKLRIGCHSGHCAAGVVGLTMPRYCLFGDTVNTASRMESHGIAERIHLSYDTKIILDQLGGYHIIERGLTDIKGKGAMPTYWLVGKNGYDKPLPEFKEIDESSDANHGLESLLSEAELKQLLTGVSRNGKISPDLIEENASRKLYTDISRHTELNKSNSPSSSQGRVTPVSLGCNSSPLLPMECNNVKATSLPSFNSFKSNGIHRVIVAPISQDIESGLDQTQQKNSASIATGNSVTSSITVNETQT